MTRPIANCFPADRPAGLSYRKSFLKWWKLIQIELSHKRAADTWCRLDDGLTTAASVDEFYLRHSSHSTIHWIYTFPTRQFGKAPFMPKIRRLCKWKEESLVLPARAQQSSPFEFHFATTTKNLFRIFSSRKSTKNKKTAQDETENSFYKILCLFPRLKIRFLMWHPRVADNNKSSWRKTTISEERERRRIIECKLIKNVQCELRRMRWCTTTLELESRVSWKILAQVSNRAFRESLRVVLRYLIYPTCRYLGGFDDKWHNQPLRTPTKAQMSFITSDEHEVILARRTRYRVMVGDLW